ncbi:hypothetical protein Z043-124228, partial [Arapaima gigas]
MALTYSLVLLLMVLPGALAFAIIPSKGSLNHVDITQKAIVRHLTQHLNKKQHHFNSEAFEEGRSLIMSGLSFITGRVQQGNFRDARERLGQIFHTLQVGGPEPPPSVTNPAPLPQGYGSFSHDFYSHSNWIELGNTVPNNNLLKPGVSIGNIAGKCSHGGAIDFTSYSSPVGGINKDTVGSNHGFLHTAAAEGAINASVGLLEDIQASVGDANFL